MGAKQEDTMSADKFGRVQDRSRRNDKKKGEMLATR